MTLMTSWAVVCDVYFLEPQTQQEGESSQQFAERVQHLIAAKAKLKVAPWDGYLKYYNLGKKASSEASPSLWPLSIYQDVADVLRGMLHGLPSCNMQVVLSARNDRQEDVGPGCCVLLFSIEHSLIPGHLCVKSGVRVPAASGLDREAEKAFL